jgi:hypothetical protein
MHLQRVARLSFCLDGWPTSIQIQLKCCAAASHRGEAIPNWNTSMVQAAKTPLSPRQTPSG